MRYYSDLEIIELDKSYLNKYHNKGYQFPANKDIYYFFNGKYEDI